LKRMDQAEFKVFYQQVAPRLRAYIARSCGSIDVTDDLLQEVFLRFLRAQDRLHESGLRTYLYRTADSVITDYWRRDQRERARNVKMQRPDGFQEGNEGNEVKSAFARLKPQQRSLLWLAYVEGCDHREIAAAAGISERSVRVLLFRARKAFLGMLQTLGIGPEVA
jgi:RNA polymerase sigma-70 factor, ECF subfamily